MNKSISISPAPDVRFPGIHAAIIMDGNGRWANARGRPRTAGHIVGARTVRTIVEAAPSCGIGTLTLYAFSADNWNRPSREVAMLMRLFRRYLASEVERCVTNSVRMTILGRRDRIPEELRRAITAAEHATKGGKTLELRIALDYSSRDAIVRAAKKLASEPEADWEKFRHLLGRVDHTRGAAKDVDLLIRTGGEQRLSDFLLWECAYAELYFSRRMWPEFRVMDLEAAVDEFKSRDRRFGSVSRTAAAG